MALSVVKYPQGQVLSSVGVSGTASNFVGSVVITSATHGLITGDFIYVRSSVGEYNGFWYAEVANINQFQLKEYASSSNAAFVNTGDVTFYKSLLTHGWNALHLPIVYKLQSTLWPTNSVDTVRTVSSYSNDNGYVKLTLSGDIKTDVTELEFVKVIFTGGTSEVYQILSWWSNSIVTISLPYTGGLTFVSVQYYYQNYHARIRIYAGLVSSHTFAAQKPYELLCEQELTPDSSGLITLNINEYLKKKVGILLNNLLLGTLPNNLDAFCQFYITYAEAYSYSAGGYGLLDYVGSYTDDSGTFTGYAVNAQLPFKNRNSGAMSDYVDATPALEKFLTPSLYPTLFGNYFDISYINRYGTGITIRRECFLRGVNQNTFIDTVASNGVGVYRYLVQQSIYLEDTIRLTVRSGSTVISETKDILVDTSCAFRYIDLSWLNSLGGFDYWRFKSLSDYGVEIGETTETTKNIYPTWPKSYGEFADTIDQETSRESRQTIVVRTENLTADQVTDLKAIKSSTLVQIVNSAYDRRTVILDRDSFVYLPEMDKLFTLTFSLRFTNDLPSQSL